MSPGRILIVDDDAFFRNLYAEILESDGYNVVKAASGKEAVTYLNSHEVDLVITDLIMPEIDGQEVLERTKQHNALTDVIVITGHGTIESAIAALKSGAFDYLRKPVNNDELLLTVRRCIEQKRIMEENQGLKRSLKLLEVSRTISSCLERDKLYEHTLDAVIQEITCQAGLSLFRDKNTDFESLNLKAVRHMGNEKGEMICALFNKWLKSHEGAEEAILPYDVKELAGKDQGFLSHFKSFLVVPVKIQGTVSGFLIVFSKIGKEHYNRDDIENATFIAEQSSLSFENVEKYVSAQEMAYVDSLTDLYNTRFLEIALEREVKRSSRSTIPFSVLFMDLDYFKKVNDVHGHLVGSKLLIEVGELLIECVREIDTVVRYGGDEFTIILVDTDHEIAQKVANRIRMNIEKKPFLQNEGLSLHVTASIGIATYPRHASDKKELLDMADKAMYCGKNKSRNTVYLAPLVSREE
ncbi:MAG: diguanylate cyclase [Deltaproteobacteria bacterium]|nr:diguanylate cyclase [Deltaproteobacteria bacterium]